MGLDNPLHIAFLVVILLLVFGARRLPEIGRSLGSGMREFKDSISGASGSPTSIESTQQAPPAPAENVPVAAQAPPAHAENAPVAAQAPAEPTRQA